MRKLAIVAMTIFGTLVIAGKLPTAQAGLVRAFHKGESNSVRKSTILVNLKHVSFVCHSGKGKIKKEHCRGMHWLKRELAKLQPAHVYLDSCTRTILGNEGGMNPHIWNGGHIERWQPGMKYGSGAYGGPQAKPAEKMSSAGADWADNIWTQIKWMIKYETDKYGSPCAALAYWNANHSY